MVTCGKLSWQSAQSIRRNIIDSYRAADPGILILERDINLDSIRETADEVRRLGLRRVVFPQSNPNPLALVEALVEICSDQIEEFWFHIYGNFSYTTPDWNRLLKLLKGYRVRLIVAAEAQKRLVLAYIGRVNARSVLVCPFPTSRLKNQEVNRTRLRARKKLGFRERDFVITYAGRISALKNVDLLLSYVARFLREHPRFAKRVKIRIAGHFDDFGFQLQNRNLRRGQYFYLWTSWFKTLPLSFRKKVQLLGTLGAEELDSLYCASDLFVSLSTFLDEDFGMAPAEALLTGCPAILSAWGGYSDFQKLGADSVSLVPVEIRKAGIKISYLDFKKALLQRILSDGSRSIRAERAQMAENSLSITAVSRSLVKMGRSMASPLGKVSAVLGRHAKGVEGARYARQGGGVFSSYSLKDPLFQRLYREYCG